MPWGHLFDQPYSQLLKHTCRKLQLQSPRACSFTTMSGGSFRSCNQLCSQLAAQARWKAGPATGCAEPAPLRAVQRAAQRTAQAVAESSL
jgi:hypothetical protein